MTATGRKTSLWVLSLFLAAEALPSATRLAASASPEGGCQQTDTKPTAGIESTQPQPADKAQSEEEKREIAIRQWGLRHRRAYAADSYEDSLIGGLVENQWWRSELPLSADQARVIKQLDELIRDASDDAARGVADVLDAHSTNYKEDIASLDRRMLETLRGGERLVSLALLTEPQAAFVLYRYTSGDNHLYVLHDKNVQELLGMTADQITKLEEVGAAANSREAQLNLWTVEPIEQEYVRTVMAANLKRMNAEALRILAPSQRKIWDAFTAKRLLPAKSPVMAPAPRADAAPIKGREISPFFRLLNEKADNFKLSHSQKMHLSRLEEITRVGLYWISLRKFEGASAAEQVSKATAECVKHAERVALFGILTENQAQQIKSAIKGAKPVAQPKKRNFGERGTPISM